MMTNEETTLKPFVAKYRLKLRIDVDETRIIPGRVGQIYAHDPARLGVMYLPPRAKTSEMWTNRKKACLAVGMLVHQDGDREGCLLFDPRNAAQAKLAIQVAGLKRKRIMSPAQMESLAKAQSRSPICKPGVGSTVGIVSLRAGEQYVVGQRVAGPQGR
jgi:hypothetical protein